MVHIQINWARIIEFYQWLDEYCPGWEFTTYDKREESAAIHHREFIENLATSTGHNFAATASNVFFSQNLVLQENDHALLTKLTWKVLHFGECQSDDSDYPCEIEVKNRRKYYRKED